VLTETSAHPWASISPEKGIHQGCSDTLAGMWRVDDRLLDKATILSMRQRWPDAVAEHADDGGFLLSHEETEAFGAQDFVNITLG